MTENPFHAVSDHKGRFTLEGLPPGKARLKLWHERSVHLRTLHPKIPPRELEVDIVPGKTTDLGRITLRAGSP